MNLLAKLRYLFGGGLYNEILQINMKLSEVKTQIAGIRANNAEAYAEIATRLAAMQTQIDDLLSGNSDPEVTDEAFLADLQALKDSAQQLADIVPTPPEPTP